MKKLIGTIVVLIILGGGGYYVYTSSGTHGTTPQPAAPAYTVPPLTQDYTNSTYHFTLKMPADFKASEIAGDPTSGSPDTIVLQDTNGNGIQIAVSPFDEDTTGSYTLTKARILQDVPDLTITDDQPVVVGSNYTGLAFRSDNQAFGGDSREVWFVFRGNLYQISTYARLDDLLKAIFGTWQFN